jgi:integrase
VSDEKEQPAERRRRGQGSIEELPSGKFRARMPGDRHPLGIFDSRELARARLDAARDLVATRELTPVRGRTIRDFGEAYITRKTRRGVRGVNALRSRFAHVLDSKFADWALEEITVGDVDAWLDRLQQKRVLRGTTEKTIATSTVRQVLSLLVSMLDDAQTRGFVSRNVAKLAEAPEERDDEEDGPWTYLEPLQQVQLVERGFPDRIERLVVKFAMGSGLRAGELVTLGLADVHLDDARPWVYVRFGSAKDGKRRGTKSRKPRVVPLFGMALEALREWMGLLPAAFPKNPHRLVFPRPQGGFRDSNHVLGRKGSADLWQEGVKRAGVGPMRWHDLRHTCASSLIAGWWGRAWRTEEVQKFLGHASIRTTERYAHLGDSVVHDAASATTGVLPTNFPRDEIALISAEKSRTLDENVIRFHRNSGHLGPSWAGCGKSAESEARSIVAGVAGSEAPSPAAIDALCEEVEAAVRAAVPLLVAVDRVRAGGRYLVPNVLRLCRLVLEGEDAGAEAPVPAAGGEGPT